MLTFCLDSQLSADVKVKEEKESSSQVRFLHFSVFYILILIYIFY